MKIEHIAFNVSDPTAVAVWYVEHLGLSVAYHAPESDQTHFLSDGEGTILEIYNKTEAPIPDYSKQHPLVFHVAFASSNPKEDADRLIQAGASWVEDIWPDKDTYLVMLRDPWGIPLQLCQRKPTFFLPKE